MPDAPRCAVALFLFNRPEPTRRVFDAIARARPPRLLVIADGPRADRAGEDAQCRAARTVVERVDWDCHVETQFSDVNLGCRRRVSTGLDWVFSRADRAIVLEDDCLPAPDFFPFCEDLLDRYGNDPRVHMIRGSNFLGRTLTPDSYYFSRFFNIWGWASWARAWAHYDVEMRRWPDLRKAGWLERMVEPHMAPLIRKLLDETHAGRLDTWDYQWTLAGWLQDAVAAVPAVNLVTNIGHGPNATHTADASNPVANLAMQPLEFPLRHPSTTTASTAADTLEWNTVYPAYAPGRWWQRMLRGG